MKKGQTLHVVTVNGLLLGVFTKERRANGVAEVWAREGIRTEITPCKVNQIVDLEGDEEINGKGTEPQAEK